MSKPYKIYQHLTQGNVLNVAKKIKDEVGKRPKPNKVDNTKK